MYKRYVLDVEWTNAVWSIRKSRSKLLKSVDDSFAIILNIEANVVLLKQHQITRVIGQEGFVMVEFSKDLISDLTIKNFKLQNIYEYEFAFFEWSTMYNRIPKYKKKLKASYFYVSHIYVNLTTKLIIC